MALGTGQLSLGDIAGEYGGSAPHALSEYYDKGNAPGSGEIQVHADFNGTANVFTYTISSNASQLNLRSGALAAGWDGSAPVNATINSGVFIYSGSTGSYAMVINGTWSGGVTLTNNGTIIGRGGQGANIYGGAQGCGGGGGWQNTADGGAGGPALQIASAVTVTNNGRISGGGGGGGGGGQYQSFGVYGGAGGGGIGNGAGGTSQNGGGAGGAGSLTGAGAGGAGQAPGGGCASRRGGNGGAGGSYAASGSNGTCSNAGGACKDSQNPLSNGGAGGAATSGQSNVTWATTGTRNGSVG